MRNLRIEGETFEAPFVPLNPKTKRPGILANVKFREVRDFLDESLRQEEEKLWAAKVKDAQKKGQVLTRGFQYGFLPEHAGLLTVGKQRDLDFPVSQITYSRIELAKRENSKDIRNVLGVSEILLSPNGYLFVERGAKVAYYNVTGQFHTLIAGGFPRNLEPIKPEDMSIEKWLDAQQMTEHAIEPKEVYKRQFLGVVLDRKLGYKPEIIFTAKTTVEGRRELSERFPEDAFESKGVTQVPDTKEGLISVILNHAQPERHVPPGFGGTIIELAKLGGLKALNELNYEGSQRGAPVIEYKAK